MSPNMTRQPFSPSSDPPRKPLDERPLLLVVLNKVVAARQGITIPEGQELEFRRRQLMVSVNSACRIATFYSENKSDMLIERDEITIMNRMAHRDVFALEASELATGNPVNEGQSTNIVALAMRYDTTLPVRDPRTGHVIPKEFCEFGSMSSRQEGFNHQKTCNAARIMDGILLGERSVPLAATYANNERSSANLVKNMFFREVSEICPELSVIRQHQLETQNRGGRGARWFKPTISTVLTLSDWINELHENPVRLRSEKSAYSNFLDYPSVQFEFGLGFPESFFTLTKMVSRVRPKDSRQLGDLVHGDPNYYPSDFLAE
jgi:hypothetical protein